MKTPTVLQLVPLVLGLSGAACGTPATPDPGDPSACSLAANTTSAATVNAAGCHVLTRDSSACLMARQAQGLSGFWLKFSCRVTLTATASLITADADGQPDYKSNYFATTNTCHETYTGAKQNPNLISTQSYALNFPRTADTNTQPMRGAVVGLSVNGVPIFANFAAPQDDIYLEAQSFDRCGGHPQMSGAYHYHSEPYALSYDDANLVGALRDGYALYGRKDADGSYPILDAAGGHSGVTADSPTAAVYHYHINQQTSTATTSKGQMQWFLTTGTFKGTPAACTTC